MTHPRCPSCGGKLMKQMWETSAGLCESAIVCENCGTHVRVEGFPITFADHPPANEDASPDTDADEAVEDHPVEVAAE